MLKSNQIILLNYYFFYVFTNIDNIYQLEMQQSFAAT